MGRPSEYDPSFCERVIELGKEGASIVEMAVELGVTRNTLLTWADEHEEFLTAFTRAKEHSQVWWEKKGRENLATSGFQSAVWSRSMAARFPHDWREVKGTELSGPNGSPIAVKAEPAEWTIVDPETASGA